MSAANVVTIKPSRHPGAWDVEIEWANGDEPAVQRGLAEMEDCLTYSHAEVAQHNVLQGRHAHYATWGW